MRDEVILATHGLTRRFGGLVAVNDVDFDVKSNEIHALLGPNGAGKSTLINLLSGEIPPSEGQVLYRGQPIQGKSARQIARLGIGRSHQKTNIFPRLNCLQNCELAARIHGRCVWQLAFAPNRAAGKRARSGGTGYLPIEPPCLYDRIRYELWRTAPAADRDGIGDGTIADAT